MSSNKDLETLGHYIGGRESFGVGIGIDSGETLDVYNPATGKVSKKLSCAGSAELEEAITTASIAFAAWRNTPHRSERRFYFASNNC